MENLKTYTFKQRYGYDDLKSEYAYRGNSQGDDSGSNDVATNKNNPWMSFGFNCPETQEAVDKEVLIRKEWNKNYVNSLKANGKFGLEYDINISFIPHPMFDEPTQPEPTFSSSFFILNNDKTNP